MSKKDKVEKFKTDEGTAQASVENENNSKEEKKIEPFKYGIIPGLTINMIREDRVYRFEMPIGAQLDECEEACKECLNVVNKMQAQAKEKMEKAKEDEDKKTESSDANSSDEDPKEADKDIEISED